MHVARRAERAHFQRVGSAEAHKDVVRTANLERILCKQHLGQRGETNLERGALELLVVGNCACAHRERPVTMRELHDCELGIPQMCARSVQYVQWTAVICVRDIE